MSSPAPFMSDVDVSQSASNPFVDIPARPMRVKVLYTFDNENKTNCLARFPEVLSIPTVPIDDNTQIGVIELRQCIRAVVAASPELVARLSQGDFTIYAYDYSEYEAPLVGQGMLSSILAAASPTPSAPAHQSKTMITGRVCKNILGLFSNGVSETLEVKLRLVPVPKPVQNDYLKSMEMYRNLSPAMSAGFDPNAWSASIQSTQLFGLGAPFEHATSPPTTMSMMDYDPQQLQRQMSVSSHQDQGSFSMPGQGPNAPISRVASPAQNGTPHYSRPSSRASVRSNHSRARQDSYSTAAMNESFQEDGPARKRAKITQSEWRGKSSFGTNSADLRVTASTAASIRIHKPVATRPGIASSSLEPPPRVPTPVPQKTGQAMGRSRSQAGNFLRRESSLANVQSYSSRYEPGQHTNNNPEVVMSSPEEDQMDETTPPELPSSPPAMPATSSPGLPTINSHMDSGYMSGSLLECQNDDEDRSPDAEDLELMVQYSARSQVLHPDISFNTINNIHADKTMKHRTPGPPENLPTRMDMAGAHKDKNGSNQAELSRQKATSAVTRRGSLALPQKPSVSQTTAQSQSTSQDQQTSGSFHKPTLNKSSSTATARSEAASPAPSEGPEAGTQRSGSGAKRRKYVESQLKQAIESGEMPTYCAHCGAIETPTWRNIFVKTMEGNPQDHVIREVEGITLAVEYIDTDPETNMVTKFRIIKSSKKARNLVETEGFDMLFVCNPCGLWFNKYKTMRPPEKWNKQSKPRKWKRNNTGTGLSEPQSDIYTDQPDHLDQPSLDTDSAQAQDCNGGSQQDADEHTEAAPARTDRPRATSMQPEKRPTDTQNRWTGADLDAALHRAIQSSPARFLGTQESPIELDTDLTPRPTRRILFPSPRKEGEVRTLDDSALPTLKEALNKGNAGAVHCTSTFNDEDNLDKENLPPPVDADDDLAHLFEGSPNGLLFKTPAKVTPTKRTPRSQQNQFDDLLKTPTPSHTRASLLCSPNANAFLPTFSPAETRNLPMTPSRNTVGSSPRGQMTPFTRHLTQLLSDTNENALLSSPGRPFDFSDLPTFLTPGRTLDFDFGDAEAMGIFSDVVEGVKEDEKVVGEGGGVEGERV